MAQQRQGRRWQIQAATTHCGVLTCFIFRILRRPLIGKSPTLIGKALIEHPITLLRALNLLKPESFPNEQNDWKIFQQFWEGSGLSTNQHYSRTKSAFAGNANPLMEHVFAGLCADNSAASYRNLVKKWDGELGRLRDLNDYFMFVAQWCGAGAGLGPLNASIATRAEEIVSVELLKSYSAKNLIRQSEYWHRLLHQFKAEILGSHASTSGLEWPSLPGLPWHHNNLIAVPLTTPKLLKHEGKRLNHCVAGYAESCLLGQSHIISIRDNTGRVYSTVEIQLIDQPENPGQIMPCVVQHRGVVNSYPDTRCCEMVEQLLDRWGQQDFQTQLLALVEFHNSPERQDAVDAIRIAFGAYSAEFLCEIASQVLPNYENVLSWLKIRLQELECSYRQHQTMLNNRCVKFGLYNESDDLYEAQIVTNDRIDWVEEEKWATLSDR